LITAINSKQRRVQIRSTKKLKVAVRKGDDPKRSDDYPLLRNKRSLGGCRRSGTKWWWVDSWKTSDCSASRIQKAAILIDWMKKW
jgi:hypothetical protein